MVRTGAKVGCAAFGKLLSIHGTVLYGTSRLRDLYIHGVTSLFSQLLVLFAIRCLLDLLSYFALTGEGGWGR